MRPILAKGDEIRIIAPSFSGGLIPGDVWDLAIKRLEEFGFVVSFGKYVKECDLLETTSIKQRLEDLHNAFADKKVKGIICAIGGYNSNFLLENIDWELIKNNPKFFGGMSDITVLCNAVLTKTGIQTYQMPNFRNFGQKLGFEYSIEYFKKVAMSHRQVEVTPSLDWSDDKWTRDQENRKFTKNSGWWFLNKGVAKGVCIGGNLCSLNLLQGTEYMASLDNKILFIEDDSMSTVGEFSRNLRSLMHLPRANKILGLVLGRFQKKTKMTLEKLRMITSDISELKSKPILANVDFGHTDPKITWVVGGVVSVEVGDKSAKVFLS